MNGKLIQIQRDPLKVPSGCVSFDTKKPIPALPELHLTSLFGREVSVLVRESALGPAGCAAGLRRFAVGRRAFIPILFVLYYCISYIYMCVFACICIYKCVHTYFALLSIYF